MTASRKLLKVLQGERSWPPPLWMMRQAGRYLPEYRALRSQAGSFLDLCYNSDLATEVTLQPVERFDMDAAILFADILLIPQALGQDLTFVAGEGPHLAPPVSPDFVKSLSLDGLDEVLGPVYQTVAKTRGRLSREKTLIGFAGAPWTVATYMATGQASRDHAELISLFYTERESFDALMALLVEATTTYLVAQIDAGADAVQLFDTWAGGAPDPVFAEGVLKPVQAIFEAVTAQRPTAATLYFPKGVGARLASIARNKVADCLGVDQMAPLDWVAEAVSPHAALQGALDPMLMISGGTALEAEIRRQALLLGKGRYIFNLGHGLTPQANPDNVARTVDLVRALPDPLTL